MKRVAGELLDDRLEELQTANHVDRDPVGVLCDDEREGEVRSGD